MTKLLQDVIERVRQWSEDRQDDAARLLLDLEAQQRLSADAGTGKRSCRHSQATA
jgi:hypothetical protein